MVKEILPTWQKSKKHSVREFLYVMSRPNAPLGQVDDVCLALLDSYERARYGAQVQPCAPPPPPPPPPTSVALPLPPPLVWIVLLARLHLFCAPALLKLIINLESQSPTSSISAVQREREESFHRHSDGPDKQTLYFGSRGLCGGPRKYRYRPR